MAASEIDDYLATLDEPSRSTLESLRRSIAALMPEAEEGLSYGVPVFRIDGRPIAGFSAAKAWLSYLPHSGDVIAKLTEEELGGFATTKGSVKMPVDTPLPNDLVRRLIEARRTEVDV